jgi:RNA polymerase sigma factor (sigma-70 family)
VVTDQYRAARPLLPLDEALAVADNRPSAETIAEQAEGDLQVSTLLARLPADQRRVVELRLAGLTGVEIARVLGRTHGSVKKQQTRALAKLRVLLENDATQRGDNRDANAN